MPKTPRIYASDKNPIGMIVASMLTESQFQELNGTSWVLADKRDVTGSQYAAITGQTTLPDLRGVFLRGKNHTRSDGNENPDGDASLGQFTSDAIRNITGTFVNRADDHRVLQSASGVFTVSSPGTLADSPPGAGTGYSTANFNASNVVPTAADNRPKNVTVNYFIKINP